jgi:1-acyl-sn-glycerol-3-phosphate acyltransferase
VFAVQRYLEERDFQPRPKIYAALADGFLRWDYLFPKKTEIIIEGLDHLPYDQGVIFAMNHSNAFDYLPFMYALYRTHRDDPRRGSLGLTAWIKAKYFDSPLLARLLSQLNMIPLPSRGYLLARDYQDTMGRPLDNEAYRLLRMLIDGEWDQAAFLTQASPDLARLMTTPHGNFDPQRQSYAAFIEHHYNDLLTMVSRLSEQALAQRFYLFVYPEGVIGPHLQTGRLGLAQFALKTGATIIPVGANGLEKVYPRIRPFAQGGQVRYRLGRPLSLQNELAPFSIAEPFIPFTRTAQARFGPQFQAATDLIMARINALLDPPYRHRPGSETGQTDIDRLI